MVDTLWAFGELSGTFGISFRWFGGLAELSGYMSEASGCTAGLPGKSVLAASLTGYALKLLTPGHLAAQPGLLDVLIMSLGYLFDSGLAFLVC